MLIGTKGLTDSVIRHSLRAMIRRAVSAAPVHVCLMLYMILSTPDLNHSHFAWICFGSITFFMAVRATQFAFFDHLLEGRSNFTAWRVFFACHTIATGLCWGSLCAISLHHAGFTTATIGLFALVSAVSAGSVTSFSFDLLIQISFQICLMTPIIVSSFLLQDKTSHALAVGYLLFLAFMTLVGRSMFRFQVDLLKNADLVNKQKENLDRTHQRLTEAHRKMGEMLESIEEGFLNFDDKGFCSGELSDKTKLILGFDPTHRHLAEVLGLEPEHREDLSQWYDYLFSGDVNFDIMMETAPKTMKAWKGNRTLKLSFHPLVNANGKLRSIIMTATDVTKELAAEARASEARDRAELILRVHENPMGFRSLMESYVKMIERMRKWETGDFISLRRDLHNMKGGMASFGARRTSERIYDAELVLKKLTPESATNFIRNVGEQLNTFYVQWRVSEAKFISQINLFDEEVIKISKRTLLGLEKRASRDPVSRQVAQDIVQSILSYEIGDQIEDFRFHVEQTAVKLGKKLALRLIRPATPVFLDKKGADVLRALVHLFNNSVDHGIESPEDRLKAGKREYGLIQVSYQQLPDGREQIVIEDDGRGINLKKLRRADDTERTSDFEIVSRIFIDGQSTSEKVSAISGQGIGMGAVKTAIENLKGEIRVSKTSATGTAFEILLPDLKVKSQAA